MGYEYHLDSALVKPTQEKWLKLQDLILRLKSKHVLTARCLMSLIGLLASMEKMVPGGCLHIRPFSFISRSTGDILSRWTASFLRQNPFQHTWWPNPTNVMRGADLHPKDHSIQPFSDASNKGWGSQSKPLQRVCGQTGKKGLHIKVLELKLVSLARQRFTDQCQNKTVLVQQTTQQ